MTTRDIVLERVVPGSPAEVFDLWLSREGVQSFFAPDAVIDPRVGGEYTILFEPELDPEGLSHGTKGARILELERGKRLTFEWITFVTHEIPGVVNAPVASPEERNVSPLPTAVELTFTAHGPDQTLVHLRHRDFPRGGKWEAAFAFFIGAWGMVLDSLQRRPSASATKDATDAAGGTRPS